MTSSRNPTSPTERVPVAIAASTETAIATWAGEHGMTVDDAADHLARVGLARLAALDKHARARRRRARGAPPHPSHVADCPGCEHHGVCAWHAPPRVPGLRPKDEEQAAAWRRGGYE